MSETAVCRIGPNISARTVTIRVRLCRDPDAFCKTSRARRTTGRWLLSRLASQTCATPIVSWTSVRRLIAPLPVSPSPWGSPTTPRGPT